MYITKELLKKCLDKLNINPFDIKYVVSLWEKVNCINKNIKLNGGFVFGKGNDEYVYLMYVVNDKDEILHCTTWEYDTQLTQNNLNIMNAFYDGAKEWDLKPFGLTAIINEIQDDSFDSSCAAYKSKQISVSFRRRTFDR